mgnify:CR=1 FL=1
MHKQRNVIGVASLEFLDNANQLQDDFLWNIIKHIPSELKVSAYSLS